MLQPWRNPIELDALLGEAVGALAVLDVAKLESLRESLAQAEKRVRLPQSAAERMRADSQRWILAHLIGETARRLAMLRRVSMPATRFGPYCGCESPAPATGVQPQN